jgi:predicted RNA binding protein YcfA (HicA-like mRNA interferase family)
MSQKIPALSPKKVLHTLLKKKAGFYVDHQTGSHVYLKHSYDPTLRVPIPLHAKDIKRGTLSGILRKAKLSREEFLRLLHDD